MTTTILQALAGVSVPALGHFLDDGFLDPDIRYLLGAPGDQTRVLGRAVTVRVEQADAAATNAALARLTPGDVLVVSVSSTHAPVGAVTAAAARAAGAAGVVVDGYVTDIAELVAGGLPVFARGVTARTTRRVERSASVIQQPIRCGGVDVAPGDIVVADENGVLALPADRFGDAVAQARAAESLEPAILSRIQAGEPLDVVLARLPHDLLDAMQEEAR